MRTPLFLAIAILVGACSAESAPDNAAGSIKQAPTQPDIKIQPDGLDAIGTVDGADSETDEAKKKKKKPKDPKEPKPKPDPTVNGPDCGEVTRDICPDSARQKMCSCTGLMKQGDSYPCGCKSEEAGNTTTGGPGPGETLPG